MNQWLPAIALSYVAMHAQSGGVEICSHGLVSHFQISTRFQAGGNPRPFLKSWGPAIVDCTDYVIGYHAYDPIGGFHT